MYICSEQIYELKKMTVAKSLALLSVLCLSLVAGAGGLWLIGRVARALGGE